jgi:pimeloyl-ACP methyl ester carboxylesterase
MTTAVSVVAQTYPSYWNAVPLLGGLADPLTGVFTTILRIFRRARFPTGLDSPRRRSRGLTLLLGGIEGPSQYVVNMARGLIRARHRGSIELFGWNRGLPLTCWFRNQTNTAHQETQAEKLAARITAYQERYPSAPVNLLAQSGGCWIVVRALEKLPEGSRVHRAVLLAPAMSPAYDISAAAARCSGGLYSIGGPGDFFFLALGTTLFGTSDRLHSPAAGWIGWHHFDAPGFRELRWHPAWLKYGYFGNHTTTSAPAFIERVVGPWFR